MNNFKNKVWGQFGHPTSYLNGGNLDWITCLKLALIMVQEGGYLSFRFSVTIKVFDTTLYTVLVFFC